MRTPPKLYNLRDFVEYGINETQLYKWKREGLLKPFAFSGKCPKYRAEDFELACKLSVLQVQEQLAESSKVTPISYYNPDSKKEEIMAGIRARCNKKAR